MVYCGQTALGNGMEGARNSVPYKALLLLSGIVFLLFGFSHVHAAPPAPTFQTDRILQHQLEQERRQQREKEREKEERLRPPPVPAAAQSPESALEGAACVLIHTIEFSGVTLLSGEQITSLKAPYLNTCMSVADIKVLIQDVTNAYLEMGYTTSRAGLPMPQPGLRKGRLEIGVQEGIIEDVAPVQGKIPDGLFIRYIRFVMGRKTDKTALPPNLFPDLIGRPLNLRDIEQGIDQMNRLPSNRATVRIEPGERPGGSRVVIDNEPKFPLRASLTHDNSGSASTGENKRSLKIEGDNLFGLYDGLSVTYSENYEEDKSRRMSEAWVGSLSIPYGYWTYSYNLSKSRYLTSQVLPNSDILYSFGNSTNHTFGADRVVHRDKKRKVAVDASLTLRDSESFTRIRDLETRSEVGSRKLTIAKAGVKWTEYFPKGMLFVNPSCSQGLKIFGALDDHDEFSQLDDNKDESFNQKAQFTLCGLYGYNSASFKLFDSKLPLQWTAIWDSQFSMDPLFGTEQFSVGGLGSVRGFKDTWAAGDSGFFLQNNVKFRVHNLLSALGADQPPAPSPVKDMDVTLFYDAGMSYLREEKSHSVLGGAGVTFSYAAKYLDANLTYAEGLHAPSSLKKGGVVYFNVDVKFD
uniref:Hemolysin activation/secretion protein n=1 Tax=Candidatus Kentrum sp. DK TaxID=2126562 RepID=A0A450SG89_9GAMM|nr:MAG: Hemolysin activation/secretion protein [Candidatus Kentron sp. DK]